MVLSRGQFHVFRFELLFTGQIEFEEHGALQLTIRESERVAEQTKSTPIVSIVS